MQNPQQFAKYGTLNLNFGLIQFETVITTNFNRLATLFTEQQQQIEELKHKVVFLESVQMQKENSHVSIGNMTIQKEQQQLKPDQLSEKKPIQQPHSQSYPSKGNQQQTPMYQPQQSKQVEQPNLFIEEPKQEVKENQELFNKIKKQTEENNQMSSPNIANTQVENKKKIENKPEKQQVAQNETNKEKSEVEKKEVKKSELEKSEEKMNISENEQAEQKEHMMNGTNSQGQAQKVGLQNNESPAEQTTQNGTKEDYIKMIESKIMELSGRVNHLELNEMNEIQRRKKGMHELELSIRSNANSLEKALNIQTRFQNEMQQVRHQLHEYKLKKESQLLRAITNASGLSGSGNGNGNGNSNGNEMHSYMEYLSEKVQYLLKCLPELVRKSDYESGEESQNEIIDYLRKRTRNVITEDEMIKIMHVLQRRLDQLLENSQEAINLEGIVRDVVNQKFEEVEHSLMERSVISKPGVNSETISKMETKVNQNARQLAAFIEEVQQLRGTIQLDKKKAQNYVDNLASDIETEKEKTALLMQKKNEHQTFMNDMNRNYNNKFEEMQNQMIDAQENLERLNNQIKLHKFRSQSDIATTLPNVSSQQLTGGPDQQLTGPEHNIVTQVNSMPIDRSGLNDLDNEVASLKKKVNKINLKIQTFKEDLLGVRDSFARDFDGLKMAIEKKADWESLKKAVTFLEDRLHEASDNITGIAQQIDNSKPDESTAAKKGWTCLCCDKDIKSFEGKLGEAKFTSIFPGKHQSPRVGGYFKQMQNDRDYRNIYLTKHRKLSKSREEA